MKKASILFLLAFLAIGSFSCKDDEPSETPVLENGKFQFDGKTYSVNSGLIYDYGSTSVDGSGSDTHYNYDFILTDGVFSSSDGAPTNFTYGIYLEMYSLGGERFNFGTFEGVNPETDDPSTVASKSVFFGDMSFDLNGDGDISETEADQGQYFVGGTITVSDLGNNQLKLEVNVTSETGKKLAFTLERGFQKVDSSGGRNSTDFNYKERRLFQ